MELKDLEDYIGTEIIVNGEVFKLGTTDDMEIPEDQIQAVWCSENYTIFATPKGDVGLMVTVETYDSDLKDDEQETIDTIGSAYTLIKTFKQYKSLVIQIATKIIIDHENKLKEEKDPANIVKSLIAGGRNLLNEREKLTIQYKKDIEKLDWLIKENGKAVSKAIAIRDAGKGDVKDE